MKHKVCIVICYFGKFLDTIDTFWHSCKNNPEFDWLVVTDCDTDNLPENVRVLKMTLKDVKELAENKIGMELRLESPYKLCDYKVAYGLIFEDYLKDFDFWGYSDTDVVYGDLKKFITDDVLENYDKIYPLGHLSLMRNNDECKKLFMKDVSGTRSYLDVYSSDESCFFDEDMGINEKAKALGFRIYSRFDFADIDGAYTSFRNVDKKSLKFTLPRFEFTDVLRKNYTEQIFYYNNGKLFQRHTEGEKSVDEEISYIHYRRKLVSKFDSNKQIFLITQDGIESCDFEPDYEIIKKYSSTRWAQAYQYATFAKDRIKMTVPGVVKDKTIAILGKSKILRKTVRKIKGK